MKPDEENPYPCTKEWPFYLDFKALGYAYLVAEQAALLLDALLDNKPAHEPARQLACYLDEVQAHTVGGWDDSVFGAFGSTLLEVRFTHTELVNDGGENRIRMWSEEEEAHAETD